MHLPSSIGRTQIVHLAIALLAVILGALIWLHAAGPGAHAGTDFSAYLTGARVVAAGGNPYHRLIEQISDTQPGATGLHASGYVYPPLLALALAPLVRIGLSDTAIWLIWTAINAIALVAMGRELNLCLRDDRSWSGTLAFAAAALLPALATYDLWLGQADLLMAALVVTACGRLARDAGGAWALLGIACAIKPTMALILLIWLWLGFWREAVAGALAALALIVVPFAMLGAAALHDYITFTVNWNGLGADAEYINQSPNGMLLRLFTQNPYTQPLIAAPWLVLPLRLIAMAAAVAGWIWAVPSWRVRSPLRAFVACLAPLPLIVLLSPLAEDIHICIIIPTLVGLGYLALAQGWHRWWATWLLVAAFAVACVPRMQEIIYPDRFVSLPGQDDPHIGPIIVMARTGGLLTLSIAALVGGCAVARRVQGETTSARTGSALDREDMSQKLSISNQTG